MTSRSSHQFALSVLALATLLAPSGCVGEAEDPPGVEERVDDTFVSFEEFKAGLPRVESGAYIVEGDILVYNDEDLASYYAEDAQPGALTVYRSPGMNIYNRWRNNKQLNLTYCVSHTLFGNNYDAVVQAMANAANDWASAAAVDFVHLAAEDAACTKYNNNVVFNVVPMTPNLDYYALSFFPGYTREMAELLISWDTIASAPGTTLPDLTLTGVLRHELGHILGFRHEHHRSPASGCPTDPIVWGWDALTSYDSASVMHYQPQIKSTAACNGTNHGDYVLTQKDRFGAAALYNFSNPIEQTEFFIRRMYLDVLKREPDDGGFEGALSWLNSCNGAPACLASTRIAIARGLLESPENRAQDPELNPASPNYKSAFLTHCYTNFLGRQPDAAGYNWWLSVLNSTNDYNDVISGFITSADYRSRFDL